MAKPRKTDQKFPQRRPSTAFKPGHAKVGGRKKGTPNRFTGALKDIILSALANAKQPGQTRAGSEEWMKQLAKKNPRAFASLLGKLLPTKIGNDDAEPFQVEMINRAQAGLSNLSDTELKSLQDLLQKIGVVLK